MANLKTYSISSDITSGKCLTNKIHSEISDSGHVNNFMGVIRDGDSLVILGDAFNDEIACDSIVTAHDDSPIGKEYKILDDAGVDLDFQNINYKNQLKNGVSYTPVFTIHDQGQNVGLIDKTEYYKNYVDENNKGDLILVVEETYTIDNSDPTLEYSARPALNRVKVWKWVKRDGSIDTINTKTKDKLYDTRRKRHIEGIRRRENIVEQLIDNVGLAGVLSGTFSSAGDAHDKLTLLQEQHAAAFASWINSGRGSLENELLYNSSEAWLDDIIPDNGSTQAMCPWMIGYNFRDYIIEKIKGNIK